MANAITTLVDAHSAAVIRIYSGAVPADADASLGAAAQLVELAMAAAAFQAAIDANPGAEIVANAIANGTVSLSGLAAFFRIYDQTGGGGVSCYQGTVDMVTGDLVLNNTTLVATGTVSITAGSITVPEG